MTDLRDPEYAERLEHEAPDEALRRRDFLQRLAAGAGVAAGLGTVLDPDALMAEAARRQRKTALPGPRNLPVDTFVVLMMENRSFDHYLGWLPGADARQAGLTFTDSQGITHQTLRFAPDFQGCAHPDPDHSWEGGRIQVNGGRMDGFLRSGDNDEFSIGYYAEEDLPFVGHAARAFTTYDRFFCSLLASTFPNREYMHAAQSYGKVDNSTPSVGFQDQGFPDSTIFNACAEKGISARYFFNDLPVSALWGQKGLARSGRVEEYYQRAASGTLPNVSFVDPSFANEGGGTSGDEHPHGDIRAGQAFMSDVVHAFMESPQWKRGALFIVYDEWGGFFDHVKPPRVPDIRASRDPNQDFGQMGIRIPAVAVSPYVRRGHVAHSVFGFESILKLIEYRFGLKPLTRRDAYAQNVGRSFDWTSKPRLELPKLPDPPAVMSAQCPNQAPGLFKAGGGATAPARARHDLPPDVGLPRPARLQVQAGDAGVDLSPAAQGHVRVGAEQVRALGVAVLAALLVAGAVEAKTFVGTKHRDRLVGTKRADTLLGRQGNDRLVGRGGRDRLFGAQGNDILAGQRGRDMLYGQRGRDRLLGGTARDQLAGGLGDDRLNGGAANDTLVGGAGNDNVLGGAGNDDANGGIGDDRLLGGAGSDTLVGGDGNDTILVGPGADDVSAGAGDDVIDARNGAEDTIDCGDGEDRVLVDPTEDGVFDCETVSP